MYASDAIVLLPIVVLWMVFLGPLLSITVPVVAMVKLEIGTTRAAQVIVPVVAGLVSVTNYFLVLFTVSHLFPDPNFAPIV